MEDFEEIIAEIEYEPPRRSEPLTPEEQRLKESLDPARIPQHVAIIMDGNRRWAQRQKLAALRGHQEGARSTRRAIEICNDLHVRILTLYVFSTENWRRPRREVDALMRLIEGNLRRELDELRRNRVCVKHVGLRAGLPESLLAQIDRSVALTRDNKGMTLNLALNYGGRREILDAAKAIAADVVGGKLKLDEIDEGVLSRHLYTRGEADPDLLIRTGGEMRISNFLPWQIAYAELWVTPVCWPDFQKGDLLRAIADYQARDRRFGSSTQKPQKTRGNGR